MPDKFPFFSIIIPTYNRVFFLEKAINSVLSQSYENWELIIVDDGSTDNTKEIVLNLNNKKIKYIYQTNQERSVARNNGINNSKGEYICFLDSDDYYLPNRLELIFHEIKKQANPIALLYTGIGFNKNNIITHKTELVKDEHFPILDFIAKAMIGVPQTCISRSILLKHQFNPIFNIGEDLELWLRIAEEFPVVFLPNQYTVIANDHENRSINELKKNVGIYQLQLFTYIFNKTHAGKLLSKDIKQELISDTYFKIARYYMFNDKKKNAIYWIFKALFKKLNHEQKKHWLLCIYSLISGNIPNEYRLKNETFYI